MAQDSPNVLLVCTDQQRPDWFGWNDDVPVETPNVARLGEEGVRFENAVCPTPVCNPCRASIASGMEYDHTGYPNNDVDYPIERGTLYRRLRDEAGYHVTGTGKVDLTASYRFGMDGDPPSEWGFSEARFTPAENETRARATEAGGPADPYTAYLDEQGYLEAFLDDWNRRGEFEPFGQFGATFPSPLPDEHYYSDWIARQGRRLIRDAPTDRPWFLQVNFEKPHSPMDVTESMHERFRDPDVAFPAPEGDDDPVGFGPELHQEVRRNYGAMVERLDDCLGRLVDAVEERGDADETVVIFTSDHGEMLGDHGQWAKDSPLHPSVSVPLVVGGPGIESRDPVEDPVTTLDLHTTALDYAGVDPGAAGTDPQSRSLRPFLEGDADLPRDVVYSGLSTWRMAFDGQFKLLLGYEPERRVGNSYEPRGIESKEMERWIGGGYRDPILYDLDGPGEPVDVADEHPDVVERLTEELHRIRGDPNPRFEPSFDYTGGHE